MNCLIRIILLSACVLLGLSSDAIVLAVPNELDSIRTILRAHDDSINVLKRDIASIKQIMSMKDSVDELSESVGKELHQFRNKKDSLEHVFKSETDTPDSRIKQAKKNKIDSLENILKVQKRDFEKTRKAELKSMESKLKQCEDDSIKLSKERKQIIDSQDKQINAISKRYFTSLNDSADIKSVYHQLCMMQNDEDAPEIKTLKKRHDILIFNCFVDSALLNPFEQERIDITRAELNKCLTPSYKEAGEEIIALLEEYPKLQQTTATFLERTFGENAVLLNKIDRTFIYFKTGDEIIKEYKSLPYKKNNETYRNKRFHLWYLDDCYEFLDKVISKLRTAKVGTDFTQEKEEAMRWLEEMRLGKCIVAK